MIDKKAYDHREVEQKLYDRWMERGYFHAEPNKDKQPYTIVIPPPNITGQLHMGHALDELFQDVLVRFRRMQGFETLWLPGTDHASIATEVKLVDQLAEEGKTKEEVGRDEFLRRAWKWKETYGGRIINQLKKLGCSCDWERERFTMDEGCSNAVREIFVRLYEKGLIYRGNRIINWCPCCKTALSDAEVEYTERDSHLWHVRYREADGGEGVVIATTRPETMFGDVAIAVHPDDPRYTHIVGKTVILPLLNKPIPVIADSYVDMEFGTGALKITPAHDINDYEVGQRHNLSAVCVMNEDGTLNENAGKYAGLDRMEARTVAVRDLEECGALVKIQDHKHNVGECYRCRSIIEPLYSMQWFVSMKSLAEPAIKAVENGDVVFVPERYAHTYFNWMYNIRDWCISRQLWWGHRIPVYYCAECNEMIVARDMPESCPKCGSKNLNQDESVLDTWFSSGLWPMSTLGWPENTAEFEYFYPTSVLVTGYDIIFFWVARMIVFALETTGKVPFKYVNIHGIMRDSQGRKMSKSLNNGIDPLEIIEKHGADALRFSIAVGNAAGSDMRFYWEKVESAGNFANKIWNAARFVMMNAEGRATTPGKLDIADKWILSRLNNIIREVTDNLDRFELGLAAQKIYEFIWNEFCDWYIEMAKPRLYGSDDESAFAVAKHVLGQALKLLHPFMPFITEEVYTEVLGAGESIMISDWPTVNPEWDFKADEDAMHGVMDVIRGVRNIRAEMNITPQTRSSLIIRTSQRETIAQCEAYLKKLAFADDVRILSADESAPKDAVSIVTTLGETFLPLGELIDKEKELARLEKERARLEGEEKRASSKLSNEKFVQKAPEQVIKEEREKLANYKEMLKKVEERIAFIASIG